MDKFEELRTFATIVEAGGVNAAAASLGIARSAVSRRLTDLEGRLGVVLADRAGRSLALTELGRAYYRDCRRLLDELAAMDGRLAGCAGDPVSVIVATEPMLANRLLSGAVASFLAAQPDARIILATEPDAKAGADVIVTADRQPSGGAFLEYRRIIVGSPAYLAKRGEPSSPADLGKHSGIAVTESGDADWRFSAGVATRPSIVLTVPTVDAAIAAAAAGVGLAQLPDHACRDGVSIGALKSVMASYDVTGGRVTIARGAGENAIADRLAEHLVQIMGAGRRQRS